MPGLADRRCRPRPTVAEVLREHAGRFVAQHSRQAAPQVQSTLAKLSLCRTAALGGRTLRCTSCDHRRVVYNSCGDRHCPTCRGARRAEWVERAGELLLPGVNCFQVVFTLPQQLSALALGNRKAIYNLLFTAAWRALRETIEQQCGYRSAALFVLHTWNQRLEHHPHLHALVPGGGPSLDGSRWINSRHPTHRWRSKPYLVDNHRLHILPRQFTKVRRCGGFSNRRRRNYLDACRELLGAGPPDAAADLPQRDELGEPPDAADGCCPRCAAPMVFLHDEPRPGWAAVMQGPACPHWYRE